MKLIKGSHEKLRKKSSNVHELTYPDAVKVANKMIKFCMAINNNKKDDRSAAGVSAVQVGIMKRIFVAKMQNGIWETFINPEILSYSKANIRFQEGCLSFPEEFGWITRHQKVKVRYYNGHEIVTKTLKHYDAIVYQHEFDHCNGIVCVDKFEKE